MLLIDKLCYQSKFKICQCGGKIHLRHTDPLHVRGQPFHSLAVLVLAVNSYLIVGRGGIAFFRYRNLMLIPLVFLLLSTPGYHRQYLRNSPGRFRSSSGKHLYYRKLPVSAPGASANPYRHGQCLLPVFSGSEHTHDGYPKRTAEASDPRPAAGTDDAHLPLHLCAAGDRLQHPYSQKSRLGNRDLKTSLKSFGSMVSVLFIRALKKSGALYDAMEARCYDGTIRVLTEKPSPRNGRKFSSSLFFEILLLLLTIWSKLQ